MAKRKRSWSGWSPNIANGPTGGTPYQPAQSGSWSAGAAGSAPAAPSGPSQTSSAIPKTNLHDAQWTQDTGGVITGAGQTATEFGASAPTTTYDANGNPTISGMQVNWDNPDGIAQNNPFSKAALLIRSYQQGVQGTSNSYAARGQHSSGAYQRAQGSNAFGFEQGKSGINTALANFMTGANQGLGQATINAITRQEQSPPPTLPGSSVLAQGTSTYGNVGANGAPSANTMLAQWTGRPDANGNAPSGLNGSVKLANGWSLVYVNGKPKFIPPGGQA